MKKIAIPTRDDKVDEHFGQCEYYSIYTIDEDDNIKDMELFSAPQGCGCKSNIASILAEKGVQLMLAGNMGLGAVNVLESNEIQVLRGCKGKTTAVINQYLKGELNDNGENCAQHDNHHGSNDHQHQCGQH